MYYKIENDQRAEKGINIRFIGLDMGYNGEKKRMGGIQMIIDFLRELIGRQPVHSADRVLDAEYEPHREELKIAGFSEEQLRQMDPDDRVAVLEQAKLDPYDYIYLAC